MAEGSINRDWLTTDEVNTGIAAHVAQYNQIQRDASKKALAVPCAESYDQLVRFVNERDIQELTAAIQGKIIVPFLKNLNHYVLVVIDQELNTITYMDPLGAAMPADLRSAFKDQDWLFKSFDVIDLQTKQQTNGYDCGVFAITNTAYVLSTDLLLPDQDVATAYRASRMVDRQSAPALDAGISSSTYNIVATLSAYAATTVEPDKAFAVLTDETLSDPLPAVKPEYAQFGKEGGQLYQMASAARARFFDCSSDEQGAQLTEYDALIHKAQQSDVDALLKTKHDQLNNMLDRGECSPDGFANAFDQAALEVAHKQALLDTKLRYSQPGR